MLRATDVAHSRAAALRAPLLFVHSRTDSMCDPEGTERMFSGCAASCADRTLVWTQDLADERCARMWHALSMEPGCECVHAAVADWITARLGHDAPPSE